MPEEPTEPIAVRPRLRLPTAGLRAAGARIAAHRRALSTSVTNQALSSGTNFTLAFVLLRLLPQADYGLYALGMSGCYLFAGLGNSLLVTQMVVHNGHKNIQERLPYATRMLAWVTLLGLGIVVLAAASAFTVSGLAPRFVQYRSVAVASALAAAGYLAKDYLVRHAYVARREACALAINGAVAVATTLLLLSLWMAGTPLNAATSLGVFAASQVCGVVAGLGLASLPLNGLSWQPMKADLLEAWRGGRWALGGSLVWWAQSQAYVYLTAAVLGPVAVGRANAARLLLSPFLLLTPSINQIVMPRLADLGDSQLDKMVKTGLSISGALMAAGVIYTLVLIGLSESLVPLVLGPRYAHMRPLVIAWAVVLLAFLVRDGASTLLQAMRRFRSVSVANAVGAAVSIPSVLILMRYWGVEGAVMGGATAEVVTGALLWRMAVAAKR